ncbi:hypothetical protein GJ744_003827 [Endocarpon pusillum]|uniref:Uncharacterized protein n=1 Tax=Endocarpon pusillum TaxID=364733 RepID=A0A8H7ANZ1_9EURO|nr:hypothetical protein GJ744_003827 [Endocarpon pusillum]
MELEQMRFCCAPDFLPCYFPLPIVLLLTARSLVARRKIMAPSNSVFTYQIKPAVPFDAEYPLAHADVAMQAPVTTRYLLWYEGGSNPSDQADLVGRLQASLQSFLCEPREGVLALPEILGKIHSDTVAGWHCIKVTKSSSIRFVVAQRNDISYKQLEPERGGSTRLLNAEIFAAGVDAIAIPDRENGVDAFSFQVTFIQGGFVIGVSKHHYVCDGIATANFITWWFKKARGYRTDNVVQDSEIVPVSKMMALHDRSSLILEPQAEAQERREPNGVRSSSPTTVHPMPPKTSTSSLDPLSPAVRTEAGQAIFRLESSCLREIHADASKHANRKISTNDAICALLWQCITRARLCDRNVEGQAQTSSLIMAVNARSKFNPPLPDQYFGNCVFGATSPVPLPILTSVDPPSLSDVAVTLRESLLAQTSDTSLRSMLQHAVAVQSTPIDKVLFLKHNLADKVLVTSWEKYFDRPEDLDVRLGAFRRLRLAGDGSAGDGIVIVLPAYGMRDKPAGVGTAYPGAWRSWSIYCAGRWSI